jgi:hypothetical protein
LCIVLDNVVQSCPSIRFDHPQWAGVITVGSGGVADQQVVNLLRYGALPIAMEC